MLYFIIGGSGVEDENGSVVRLPLCPPFSVKGMKRIKGECGRNEFSNSKMLDCCSCFAENMRVNFFRFGSGNKNQGRSLRKNVDNPSFFQRSLYRFTRRRSIVFFPAGKSFPDSRQK